MNVRLLRKIQKHILAEPKRYDQNSWLTRHSEEAVQRDAELPKCGTVGCIAGWAVMLGFPNYKIISSFSSWMIEDKAVEALALTGEEAEKLFSGVHHSEKSLWPKKFQQRYLKAKTRRGRARVAVQRIDHFIKTKGRA